MILGESLLLFSNTSEWWNKVFQMRKKANSTFEKNSFNIWTEHKIVF